MWFILLRLNFSPFFFLYFCFVKVELSCFEAEFFDRRKSLPILSNSSSGPRVPIRTKGLFPFNKEPPLLVGQKTGKCAKDQTGRARTQLTRGAKNITLLLITVSNNCHVIPSVSRKDPPENQRSLIRFSHRKEVTFVLDLELSLWSNIYCMDLNFGCQFLHL